MPIQINRSDYYKNDEPVLYERTKMRLKEISDLGLEEVGTAEFGIRGVMSGLYIERVWSYSPEEWDEHVRWIKTLKREKSLL